MQKSSGRNKEASKTEIKIEKYFKACLFVNIGIVHNRAFDEFQMTLYRNCVNSTNVICKKAEEKDQKIVMGTTYRIEVHGRLKKDVKQTIDKTLDSLNAFIKKTIEKEKERQRYSVIRASHL